MYYDLGQILLHLQAAQIMIDAHSVIPWFWRETAKIEKDRCRNQNARSSIEVQGRRHVILTEVAKQIPNQESPDAVPPHTPDGSPDPPGLLLRSLV